MRQILIRYRQINTSSNSYYEKTLATGAVRSIDDEIPFDIPQSWEWCRLGFIIDFSKSKSIKNESIMPDTWVLDLEDIEKDTGKLLNRKLMKDVSAKSDKHSFNVGNVLYSKLRPYLNKVLIADADGVCTSEILVFDFSPLYNKYAQLYLMSPFFVEYAMSDAYGVKMPRLGSKQGNNALIPVPPLNEQYKIVERYENLLPMCETYADTYELLRYLNGTIKSDLKKSILQEAIQGRLVPQIESEGTAEELLEEIRVEKKRLFKEGKLKKSAIVNESRIFRGDDNKYYLKSGDEVTDIDDSLFNIPESWRWMTLGELIIDSTGLSYKKEDLEDRTQPQTRVLRGGNIDDGCMAFREDDVFISSKYVPKELNLQKGTFISPAVSSLEKIGKTAIVENDFSDVVVGGFVLMLTPTFSDEMLKRYLYYFFQGAFYHNFCKTITKKSGQAFYNLSRQKLKQCPVPIPPKSEIPRILKHLETALASIMSR